MMKGVGVTFVDSSIRLFQNLTFIDNDFTIEMCVLTIDIAVRNSRCDRWPSLLFYILSMNVSHIGIRALPTIRYEQNTDIWTQPNSTEMPLSPSYGRMFDNQFLLKWFFIQIIWFFSEWTKTSWHEEKPELNHKIRPWSKSWKGTNTHLRKP